MFYILVEYPSETDLFTKIRDWFKFHEWKIAKVFIPEHEIIEVHEDDHFYENDEYPKTKNWREKWEK